MPSASGSDAKQEGVPGGRAAEEESPLHQQSESDGGERVPEDGYAMTLRPYAPPSFLTPLGALAKRRLLKRRGFPSLLNWRFVTLTMDPNRWPDPEQAYECGKAWLRKFVFALRRTYGIRRWCWKLEFQDNGFPHWHLLFDYKRSILAEDLTRLWGRGRTDIRRVDDEDLDYVFKYVAKELDDLPIWILQRHRVRFFQTSMGFFDSPADAGAAVKKRPSPRPQGGDGSGEAEAVELPKSTIEERLQRWCRTVVSRSVSGRGGRAQYRLWHLEEGATWGTLLVAAAKHLLGTAKTAAEMTVDGWKVECFSEVLRWLPLWAPRRQSLPLTA